MIQYFLNWHLIFVVSQNYSWYIYINRVGNMEEIRRNTFHILKRTTTRARERLNCELILLVEYKVLLTPRAYWRQQNHFNPIHTHTRSEHSLRTHIIVEIQTTDGFREIPGSPRPYTGRQPQHPARVSKAAFLSNPPEDYITKPGNHYCLKPFFVETSESTVYVKINLHFPTRDFPFSVEVLSLLTFAECLPSTKRFQPPGCGSPPLV